MKHRFVFAHGLEGSPRGRKVQTLAAAGLPVLAPDFQGMGLAQRLSLLQEVTRDGCDLLAGSSYGGLAAAITAWRYPERFKGLLLCCPALNLAEEPLPDTSRVVIPESLACVVIHGRQDTVVPIEVSRDLVERSGPHVSLVEVDDDHRLAESLDVIVAAAHKLLGDA